VEHEFGWRVGVVEGEGGVWGEGEGFRVEGEDVNAVGVFFESFRGRDGGGERARRPWRRLGRAIHR